MKIGQLFGTIGSAIVKGATKLFTLIAEANILNIAKAGLFIGTAAVTVYVSIKALRNRTRVYTDDSKMSTVDRALALNYADKRNRDSLNPLMREVKKNLAGKSNKRRNNFKKKGSKYFRSILRGIENSYEETDPHVLNELEKFKNDMEEIAEEERSRSNDSDNFVLRRAWSGI